MTSYQLSAIRCQPVTRAVAPGAAFDSSALCGPTSFSGDYIAGAIFKNRLRDILRTPHQQSPQRSLLPPRAPVLIFSFSASLRLCGEIHFLKDAPA
jgi:hypothetical protein